MIKSDELRKLADADFDACESDWATVRELQEAIRQAVDEIDRLRDLSTLESDENVEHVARAIWHSETGEDRPWNNYTKALFKALSLRHARAAIMEIERILRSEK